jgi:hypothetical protein
MSSVYEGNIPTRPAGENLTGKQYYFAILNASNKAILPTDETQRTFGVLQQAGELDSHLPIMVNGQTRVIASEALALNALVAPAVGGKAKVAAAGQLARGVVVEPAAADGDEAVIRLLDSSAAIA